VRERVRGTCAGPLANAPAPLFSRHEKGSVCNDRQHRPSALRLVAPTRHVSAYVDEDLPGLQGSEAPDVENHQFAAAAAAAAFRFARRQD